MNMNVEVLDIEANSETGAVQFVMFSCSFEEDGVTYEYKGKHKLPDVDPDSSGFVQYSDLTKETVEQWVLNECDVDHFKEHVKNESETQSAPTATILNKPWEDE